MKHTSSFTDKKIIEVNNLSFSYDNHDEILSNVSFNVEDKNFVGIIGPNGGGKTTLIKLLLGLLPSKEGNIKVFGKRPGKNPHHVAYLPQHQSFDQLTPITVEEVVLMGCLGHHCVSFFSRQDKSDAHLAMKTMNVFDLRTKLFSSLSGGQKQRVLLARTLTCNPRLLILDEPYLGIDSHHEQVLMELLEKLNKDMAIIVVSHEFNLVSPLVDYVICVNQKSHIHYPHEITEEIFRDLISKKYHFVTHDHKVKRDD